MVAYTTMEEKSERRRGEEYKFIDLRFERCQFLDSGKEEEGKRSKNCTFMG